MILLLFILFIQIYAQNFHVRLKGEEIVISYCEQCDQPIVQPNELTVYRMTINEGVERITSETFKNIKIKQITIPSSLQEFDELFVDTSTLEMINLNKNNKYFEKRGNGLVEKKTWKMVLYENANEIQDPVYNFDKRTMIIGAKLFKSNKNITQIILNDFIETIKQEAFSGMLNLSSIILNTRLHTIEEKVFSDTPLLKTIYFGGKSSPSCPSNAIDSSATIDLKVHKEFSSTDFFGKTINP